MAKTTTTRRFVPADVDLSDWSQLEPLFDALRDRQMDSPDAVEQWLADLSELMAAVSEYGARRRIDQACHTDDPEIEKAFLQYVEQIAPKLRPAFFELQKKLLDSPGHKALEGPRYAVMLREWQADVELFRPANVPLETEVTKLVSSYDKLIGAMEVDFQGKKRTLQQLAKFLEEPDRAVREQVWTLSANRRLEDRDAIESTFDKLLDLRQQIATNADKADYREYTWQARARFDYSPEDCLAFADAIEQVCMPLVRELDEQRKAKLGVDSLRPWDMAVDVAGRAPLSPFDADDPSELVRRAGEVFGRVSPTLAEEFGRLSFERNLDLESRRGKRAGGFQSALEESGEPFIFMNAAGVQRDVETLLHEGGHAFHFLWSWRAEPLVFLRHAPLEFCEVASMAMELMGSHHLDVFYADAESQARAQRNMLEGIVRFFPWMATIDSFQHWLYTNPGHTADERREHWLSLMARFTSPVVDWSGFEQARAHLWHRQLHLFHHPFYYIEYGIAQLGALQLWARFKQDREQALQSYQSALTLGGTRPLPQLFEAAGLRFDFTRDTLEPLMQELWGQLDALPERG
ncbi:M3 family oligoendopeptidase [Phycisphaerales bacterium AB-hyl4]|uniref:M3 family oligoendopeptidase n=1 Tax=Natronomicrosphaera hydrolytica TaxID=3242702 RepID=A0ABV4UAM4_9BACT